MKCRAPGACAFLFALSLVGLGRADEPVMPGMPPGPAVDGLIIDEGMAYGPPVVESGPIQGPVFDECVACPRWTITADTLYFDRSDVFEQTVLREEIDDDLIISRLDASDLELDNELGARIRLIRHTPSGWGIELNYMGLDWSEGAAFDPITGALRIDRDMGMDVTSAYFNYESEIHSVELNFRKPLTPWITPLVGFRWVGLYEDYGVAGLDAQDVPVPYALRYGTDNNLYGFQMGLEGDFWNHMNCWRVAGSLKGGIYYGDANLDVSLTDLDRLSEDDGGVSFLGEFALLGVWNATEWLQLRAGYQLMWIEGVALAPEQIPVTSIISDEGSAVNAEGSPFYHGPFGGVELTW